MKKSLYRCHQEEATEIPRSTKPFIAAAFEAPQLPVYCVALACVRTTSGDAQVHTYLSITAFNEVDPLGDSTELCSRNASALPGSSERSHCCCCYCAGPSSVGSSGPGVENLSRLELLHTAQEENNHKSRGLVCTDFPTDFHPLLIEQLLAFGDSAARGGGDGGDNYA